MAQTLVPAGSRLVSTLFGRPAKSAPMSRGAADRSIRATQSDMTESSQIASSEVESREIREASLGDIAIVFLKLGTIAFGGPAAHLAMMEEEFVRRRQWITHADFLDRLVPMLASVQLTVT